jgi:hypothetical protein
LTAGSTVAVQNLHRVAATGMSLRHSGQERSVASAFRWATAVSRLAGTTTK